LIELQLTVLVSVRNYFILVVNEESFILERRVESIALFLISVHLRLSGAPGEAWLI
jgi:hypothetical protein